MKYSIEETKKLDLEVQEYHKNRNELMDLIMEQKKAQKGIMEEVVKQQKSVEKTLQTILKKLEEVTLLKQRKRSGSVRTAATEEIKGWYSDYSVQLEEPRGSSEDEIPLAPITGVKRSNLSLTTFISKKRPQTRHQTVSSKVSESVTPGSGQRK